MSDIYVLRTRSAYVIGVYATLADALAAPDPEHGDTVERWTVGAPESGTRVATRQVWDEWTDDNFELVFDAMGLSEMPSFPTIRT